MPKRDDVLHIYCSDGRSRKPDDVRGNLNHAIRLPGGLLFPNLCANSLLGGEQTFEMSASIDIEIANRINQLMQNITPETGFTIGELIILIAVKEMVRLKNPCRIILMTHTYCGAANALSLSETEICDIYAQWEQMLQGCFPDIPIEIKLDRHCETGEHHAGHEDLKKEAA
jgi:hypothetical protein